MDIDGNLCRQADIAIVISFLSALCLLETWLKPMGQTTSWERLPRSCQTDIGHGYAHSLHVASCDLESLRSRLKVIWAQVWYGNRAEGMEWALACRWGESRQQGWGEPLRGGESPSGEERSGRTQVSPSTIDLCVPLHILLPGLALISHILHSF